MKPSPYLIRDTIALSSTWAYHAKGMFSVRISEPGDVTGVYAIPEAELAALHPLLPTAMKAAMALNADNGGRANISGEMVGYTLQTLAGDIFELKDDNGIARVYAKIYDLSTSPADDRMVMISGRCLTLQPAHPDYNNVPFSTSCDYKIIEVSGKTLENQYPGWEARLLLGTELDMDKTSLYKNVFSKSCTTTPTADMGAVEFNILEL